MKARVCTCEQCRYVKNKRKNRNNKSIIARLINKKRRQNKDEIFTYFWA